MRVLKNLSMMTVREKSLSRKLWNRAPTKLALGTAKPSRETVPQSVSLLRLFFFVLLCSSLFFFENLIYFLSLSKNPPTFVIIDHSLSEAKPRQNNEIVPVSSYHDTHSESIVD